MKDDKSRGVDGIPPKLLMETVEQINMPIARLFTYLVTSTSWLQPAMFTHKTLLLSHA